MYARAREAGVNLIRAEVRLGVKLCSAKKRSNARRAYNAAVNLCSLVALTEAEAAEINGQLEVLKSSLIKLDEVF